MIEYDDEGYDELVSLRSSLAPMSTEQKKGEKRKREHYEVKELNLESIPDAPDTASVERKKKKRRKDKAKKKVPRARSPPRPAPL